MPGHSLGRVWLGAPHATVRQIWGRPYMIRRDGSYTIEFWHVNRDEYKAAVFRRGRVVPLETDAPRYKTPHGISVASNLGQIRKILGKMRLISYGRNDPDPEVAAHAANYYDSVSRGLAFELGLGYQADLSTANVPHSLFVHRRGRPFVDVGGKEVWITNGT